jgi:UPF0755 protein
MNNPLAKGLLLFTLICFTSACVILSVFFMLQSVEKNFGPADDFLSDSQRLKLSLGLYFEKKSLLEERDIPASSTVFTISYGESLASVADRLKQLGYIGNEKGFLHYLQYKGLDQSVQAGEYQVPGIVSDMTLANLLQDATPTEAIINILAGWRLEEVADSLPTTGVEIQSADFLAVAKQPRTLGSPFDMQVPSMEGLLYPGRYRVARDITAEELVAILYEQFQKNLSGDVKRDIEKNGLTLYQGIIMASMLEREAVKHEEMPTIASVFYNRIEQGMKMESDPTIQYGIGQEYAGGPWWKVPLTYADLNSVSLYNTYQVEGLPPTPICSPSTDAIAAVANPEKTDYIFFMAKCDHSGWHNFSVTFEQHLANICN